ncbi:hypothetical protein VitviT2T_006773 [Vitis vinifera]|uniref:Uncharacterized protein n=1 Tax=Vitis vinifera TaxID=29760 RepID=A0ABY9BX24_VITVI|nr:hypothetical protein VitviT2T_006773 [Vitis vinifera]
MENSLDACSKQYMNENPIRANSCRSPTSQFNSNSVGKSVEYLVEASATEAETLSAALAAAKVRKINGDVEQIQDNDDGVKTVPTRKQNSTLIMSESTMLSNILHGVQLHHRVVVVAVETGSALDCMVGQLSID